MKNITEYILESNELTYQIWKFEYKGDTYKILIEESEKTTSHIYPIYKNDDTSIENLDFNYAYEVNHNKNLVDNFKYCKSLTDEDYKILQKKWPFVKIFKNKTVKISEYKNVDKSYIE